jgi:putative membrane protein
LQSDGTNMLATRLALITALLVPAIASADTAAGKTKLTDPDIAVLAHVHAVNQTEISMGKLAQKNGGKAVQKYGKELVDDHTKADKDTTKLAKDHGVSKLPDDTTGTPDDNKMMVDEMAKLNGLKGDAFDSEFTQAMSDAHTKELAKAQAAAGSAADPTVKALLTGIAPVMQKHIDDAKALHK